MNDQTISQLSARVERLERRVGAVESLPERFAQALLDRFEREQESYNAPGALARRSGDVLIER
jgi:hypothetical protein